MARRILLVEGKDDQHVMWAMLTIHDVPQVFDVRKPEGDGGIEDLLNSLPAWLKAAELERIALIVDADEDAQSRWQQIKSRLENAGCTALPDHALPGGAILQIQDGPRVGVWMMPDNQLSGM